MAFLDAIRTFFRPVDEDSRLDVPMPNNFDLIRLLAAFAVIGQHTFRFIEGANWLWLTQPHDRFLYWFIDGVPVFFMMSGLLVYRSAERAIVRKIPIREFYMNRFLRVAPLIWAYMLLVIPLYFAMGVLSVEIIQNNLGQFGAWIAANLFLVPVYNPTFFDVLPTGATNGSLWTIPVECSYYVVVPLFVLAAVKWGFNRMLIGLFILAVIGTLLRVQLNMDVRDAEFGGGSMAGKLVKITFFPHLLDFALGIFWLKYWKRVKKSAWIALACVLVYIYFRMIPSWVQYENAALMLGNVNLLDGKSLTGPFWRFFYLIPLSYAVMWVGYTLPTAIGQALDKIGDMSFGVYVWHIVLINVTAWPWLLLPQRVQGIPGAYLFLIQLGTLIMGYLSWHLIEKRALRLKKYTSRTASA